LYPRWLAALGLVLALVGSSMASPVLETQKYSVERPLNHIQGAPLFNKEEMEALLGKTPAEYTKWTMHTDVDPMDLYYFTLLHDEDWSDWQDFIGLETKVIPLGSARRVLYLVSAGFTSKRPLSLDWGEPTKAKAYVEVLRRMYYRPDPSQLGFLRLDAPPPQSSRWSLMRIFTQDKGLFSGRPWSWDNFLPRLFTIGGMLIGGLLGIELLRFILRAGLRLGGRRRSGPPGTREES
jgi:hypothetical protein